MKKIYSFIFVCVVLVLTACVSDSEDNRDDDLVIRAICAQVFYNNQEVIAAIELTRRVDQYLTATDEVKSYIKRLYFNNYSLNVLGDGLVLEDDYVKMTFENNGKTINEISAIWKVGFLFKYNDLTIKDALIIESVDTYKWNIIVSDFYVQSSYFIYNDGDRLFGNVTVSSNRLTDENLSDYLVSYLQFSTKSSCPLVYTNKSELTFKQGVSDYYYYDSNAYILNEGKININAYPKGKEGRVLYEIDTDKKKA